MKIFAASTNKGKLREFGVEPLPGIEALEAPEETGQTFDENAAIKAVYYSRFTGAMVLADDSGLEVDALGGAPGVYSARFAGPHAGDEENNQFLLRQLEGKHGRSARYVCVIAVAQRGEVLGTFRGEVEGSILTEPRGTGGFGYDSLFYYPPFGCTFAEATPEHKQQVSHRGKALALMHAFLRVNGG